MRTKLGHLAKACLLLVAAGGALASSHREAPFITTAPKVDGTDFYMFRSYEGIAANGTGGRSDFVTLLANYQPLQAPYGGPNYFQLDPNALYEIHIDNTGDGVEDITFQCCRYGFRTARWGRAESSWGRRTGLAKAGNWPAR